METGGPARTRGWVFSRVERESATGGRLLVLISSQESKGRHDGRVALAHSKKMNCSYRKGKREWRAALAYFITTDMI
jgi:hypothetical protein